MIIMKRYLDAKEGMTNLFSFLYEQSHGKSTVLVAHNGHVFDDKVKALNRTGLTDELNSILAGFTDMLSAFCKRSPSIPHKQNDLYASIVRVTNVHSASDDAVALARFITVSTVHFHDLKSGISHKSCEIH